MYFDNQILLLKESDENKKRKFQNKNTVTDTIKLYRTLKGEKACKCHILCKSDVIALKYMLVNLFSTKTSFFKCIIMLKDIKRQIELFYQIMEQNI